MEAGGRVVHVAAFRLDTKTVIRPPFGKQPITLKSSFAAIAEEGHCVVSSIIIP